MASTCQEIRPLEFSLWNTTLNKQVHSSVSFLVLLILQSTEKSKNEGKCKLQPSLKAEQGGPAWVPINIFNLLIFTISKGEYLPNKLRKLWEILITFWKRWSRLATFFFFLSKPWTRESKWYFTKKQKVTTYFKYKENCKIYKRGRQRMRWLNVITHSMNKFAQTAGDSEGQGSLACSATWGRKESGTTEWLNNNKYKRLDFKLWGRSFLILKNLKK